MPILNRRSFNTNKMPYLYTMEYYSSFLKAILLFRVSCIRVTHPCATRHQEQALMLPFDLHVLGMPPAFVLSQDQTLKFVKLTNQARENPLARLARVSRSRYLHYQT